MKISRALPQPNFVLLIETEEGKTGFFDVQPYLNFEAFQALSDPEEFNKVRSGGHYIEWNCGADLSADTIEAHLSSVNLKSKISKL